MATPLQPIRGGAHESHEFFLAQLIPISLPLSRVPLLSASSLQLRAKGAIHTPVFFDNGSICSWVEPGLADVSYRTEKPVQLAGIGGKTGPQVRRDALVRLRFRDTNGVWLPYITISCGVCAAGTFPAPLTIGRHVFQQLDIGYSGRNLILRGMPGVPSLPPMQASEIEACRQYNTRVGSTKTTTSGAVATIFSTSTASSEVGNLMLQLRAAFPGVFDAKQRQRTVATKTFHRIELNDDRPIKVPSRRYSPQQEAALRVFTRKGTADKIFERGESEHSAPALLVPKKPAPKPMQINMAQQLWKRATRPLYDRFAAAVTVEKSIIWRFCVDYRRLNAATVKHAHPLPNVADQIQRAAGHNFYCFLDLKDGFWQIEVAPEDRHKTAFSTLFGLFVWNVMPFGLANAPATFQAFIEEVLEPCRDFTTGLLDDICVFANTLAECFSRTRAVLERLAAYGLVLNTKKCEWFVDSGKFLGFIISRSGVRCDPAKISAVLERPPPTTATEVRSFLNAAGYFRHFIQRFAHQAACLYDLTGLPKGAAVTLTAEQLEAWRQLRAALTQAPLLKPYNWTLPVVLETDSSQTCAGAVLLQPYPRASAATSSATASAKKTLHPVAYMSKKLTPTQQRYATQEHELLAVTTALEQWRHWLEGADITVVTDHDSLKMLRTKQEQPARMLRFLGKIEHFGVNIVYRKGKANVVADWLSRPPIDTAAPTASEAPADSATTAGLESKEGEGPNPDPVGDSEASQHQEQPHRPAPQPAEAEEASLRTLNWLDLQAIFEHLARQQPPPPKLPPAWVRSHFAAIDDILYRRVDQVLLKVPVYTELVVAGSKLHRQHGHCSAGTVIRELSTRWWHPELSLAAYEAIQHCPQCQLMKKPDPTPQGLLPIAPSAPLARWAVDHTGPVGGYKLLNAIEYATGWAESFAVPDEKADTTLRYLEALRVRFGPLKELVSDNGTAFINDTVMPWLQQHGIRHIRTTPAYPRTNGRVERFNGVLKEIINKTALDFPQQSFTATLQHSLYIYNRRPGPHGYSPYYLLYGTGLDLSRPIGPAPLYMREPTAAEEAAFVEDLVRVGHASAERHYAASLKASRDAMRARLQEDKAFHRIYMVGDWVLRVRRRQSKNEPYYDGPWLIRSIHPGNTYRIGSPGGIQLDGKINGIYLYPAYVADGHPERSLWYANKTLLEQDRRRQLGQVGLEATEKKPPQQRVRFDEAKGSGQSTGRAGSAKETFSRARFALRDPPS
jgi:transposase InsO family protein